MKSIGDVIPSSRQSLLASLRGAFTGSGTGGHLEVLVGPSGIGKTFLTRHYVRQRAKDYAWVGWLRANDHATLSSDYLRLAKIAKVPLPGAPSQPIARESIRRHLSNTSGWLLVFDGASSLEELEEYLPKPLTGHVLVTSRNESWQPFVRSRPVPLWEPEDVVAILREGGKADRSALATLADDLGRFPLVAALAAAYLREAKVTPADYRSLLRRRLPQSGRDSVTLASAALALTLEALAQRSPGAANVLCLTAFLAPDAISLDMLRGGALPLPEALLEAIASESSWKTTLAILSDYGVGSADGELLNLSPLIQAFLRDQLGDAGRRSWAEIAAHVVGAAYTFDPGRPETWDVAERMLGHALVVAAFAQTFEVALGPAGRLLNQAGLALARLGLWRPAKEIFLQALVVAERVYGSEHLTSAMAASNVSLALQQVGDPVEARRYGDRALQITEAFYGQAHPAVAGSLMNLATIYEAVGASEAAWEHLSRARSILERVRDQQGLLALLQRLANLAGQSDDLERLVTTLEASFRLQEQIGDHAAQAGILGQLGLALARRGQPELAVERFQKALQLYQALGDRANEAFILNQTGVLISMQGNVVHGLSLTVLSYLLYESLGRPEAEIAYQNIARQVAQAKLGVDQVVSVLRQATEIYRNNRYDPRIAAPLTVPVAAPAQPAEAIDQLVSEPEPKRESTHLPEAVTGTEVPVASVETLSTVGESVLILEESSKDRANGSSPRLDGETSRAPAKLYQDDRELMALARRIARRLDGMTDIDKSIQLRWQTYFQDAQRILKISCDDGIFTDALHAAGLTVEELEVEPRLFDAGHGDSQVSITRAQEHLVNYAESYDGIFLPYVVEYLDGTALLRLLRDCRNALRSTGTVLILTPNFRNADVASEVFWLDLARQRPYPPRLLNEILIELGLDIWEQSYVADGHVVCLAARLPATIPKGERDLVGEH